MDFLDALASDRQYRRALPLEEAMKRLSAESGKSFDPKVVRVLERRYRQLEKLVEATYGRHPVTPLSTEMKVEAGAAPAAGFEDITVKDAPGQEATFLSSIAAARQEAQTLFELSQDLGASLSLGETLSVFSVKLRRLVPYDAIAIYVKRDAELIPELVSGDNHRLFSSLRIPWGSGLSGWVAQNRKPIINGNPSVEPGYLNDPTKFSTLRSALAIPLEGLAGVVGVLALYHAETDAFTSDHLRILLAISSKMALAIENAVKYQQAESSAITDYLTGLPNARSLFLQLDRELARCKRDTTSLVVMVSDMDGFKQINDRFGHLEGNRVLRLFAQALKESCREYDYVARMGGDEFVVVAPGPDCRRCRQEGGEPAGTGAARRAGSLQRRHPFAERGTGPLSGRWKRRGSAAGRSRSPHVHRKTETAFAQEPPPVSPNEMPGHHRIAPAGGRSARAGQPDRRQPGRLLCGNQHAHARRLQVESDFLDR